MSTKKQQTVVTFSRSVIVPHTENMTDAEIHEKAVDLYNDPPGGEQDMMVYEGNITDMQHEDFDPNYFDDEPSDT